MFKELDAMNFAFYPVKPLLHDNELSTQPQRFTFIKQQRLLNSTAFTPVFTTPTFKAHQPNLLFFVRLRDNLHENYSRLGLAITKKKVKRANQRNRIKRLAREYFRLHQHELNKPVDIVIIVKHFPVTVTNNEIMTQLESAFKQVNHKLTSVCSQQSLLSSI